MVDDDFFEAWGDGDHGWVDDAIFVVWVFGLLAEFIDGEDAAEHLQ